MSKLIQAQKQISDEWERSLKVHGNFKSLHDAYAVILEELDEFWEEVRKKRPDNERLKEEITQVAAMALKILLFLEDGNGKHRQSSVRGE